MRVNKLGWPCVTDVAIAAATHDPSSSQGDLALRSASQHQGPALTGLVHGLDGGWEGIELRMVEGHLHDGGPVKPSRRKGRVLGLWVDTALLACDLLF